MYRKISFLCIILVLSFFGKLNVFSASIPIENVFVDIDKNYEYYNELQTLYDKGMFRPDEEGKFNPYELLTRAEFVGIASEVTCTKCIQPYVDSILREQYTSKPFFDVEIENPYFYCINDAKQKGFVKGYDVNFTCNDETFQSGQAPFCVNNTIILEEALAVVMRMSGILTNEEAEAVREQIKNGNITENIAQDVSPKNLDGSVYSFYPDFQKAVEYKITERDGTGQVIETYLLDPRLTKLRPKQSISKQDFLRIAYVALKASSCSEKEDNTLALRIDVYDQDCSKSNMSRCDLSKGKSENNIYDFSQEVAGYCKNGIMDPEGYIWRFYNMDSGQEIKKYGSYIDNHEFLSPGERKVFLRVIDSCGNSSEVHNTFIIGDTNLYLSLDANPIIGKAPLKVDFRGIASYGSVPYSYEWDHGDGQFGIGRLESNVYRNEGLYESLLTLTDSSGIFATASVFIKVQGEGCSIDEDNDDINNCDDMCPLIPGVQENAGCPILEISCEDTPCGNGYECRNQEFGIGVCLPQSFATSCHYTGGSYILGNALSNVCPSDTFLDYRADIRSCDFVFPAITSPDFSTIYSRGEIIEVE